MKDEVKLKPVYSGADIAIRAALFLGSPVFACGDIFYTAARLSYIKGKKHSDVGFHRAYNFFGEKVNKSSVLQVLLTFFVGLAIGAAAFLASTALHSVYYSALCVLNIPFNMYLSIKCGELVTLNNLLEYYHYDNLNTGLAYTAEIKARFKMYYPCRTTLHVQEYAESIDIAGGSKYVFFKGVIRWCETNYTSSGPVYKVDDQQVTIVEAESDKLKTVLKEIIEGKVDGKNKQYVDSMKNANYKNLDKAMMHFR